MLSKQIRSWLREKRCSANLPDADADADSDGDSDNVCMKETNNDSVAMLMVVF